MNPAHEDETREYTSNMGANIRHVSADRMRQFEDYVQIIGLSKLTRLVRLFAKRFTVQERIGQQIADSLDAMLHPHGVAVCLDAHHLCTQMRGVRETAPLTRTTFWRGNYEGDPSSDPDSLQGNVLRRRLRCGERLSA